ncbi:MAG TPA: NADP-dependent oxidoreductase [Streptosporangiaceae bacterium]|nr:NADP-dependent oxidoreductase [Streptosporangiaceae bacterium]
MATTMQAISQDRLGPPDVLHVVTVPRPEPAGTEVLVRVLAAGVNPVDWKTRADGGRLGPPPFTVGWDVAGVVESLGEGVTRFAVGDRVFGMPWFPREAAAYAQYVTCPSRQLAATPDTLDDAGAAGLPLTGLIAWQSLIDTAGVTSRDRVLIQGAAGGVGSLAVQIARQAGAYVIGTAGPQDQDFLAELGVNQPIDHSHHRVTDEVADVDVVLDLVGGEVGMQSLPVLRDGGLMISVPSATDLEPLRAAAAGRVRVTGILVEPDRTGMDALAALASAGALRQRIARMLPLDQAARAHELGETGRAGGKMILIPDSA